MLCSVLLSQQCSIWAQTGSNPEFGRLKPQYESFQWQSFQTTHFDVYFHNDGEYLGRFASQILEESLISLERTLGFMPTKRIPVLVYNSHNQFQQTNTVGMVLPRGVAGVTESSKNRIVVPFEGNWSKFRHVLFHELVHAYTNDFFFSGTIQSAVSNQSRTDFPTWLSEGLAEYLSLQGLDAPTDMFMRDLTLTSEIPDLNRVRGVAQYRVGQTFWWLVNERFGTGKMIEVIARLRGITTLDNVFRTAFSVNVKEMSEVFREEMKKIYANDVHRFDSPDRFMRRLTNHIADKSVYNSTTALSSDGTKSAFISGPSGQYGIYSMNLSNGETNELLRSGRGVDFEELTLLTASISWNPQSSHIVTTAKAGGSDALFVVQTQTGDVEKLPFTYKTISAVAWSPDGQKIAFIGVDGCQPDIMLYDIQSRQISKITDDIFGEYAMTWSPDSRLLYFTSDRGDHIGDGKKATDFGMWEHDVSQSDVYSIDIETLEMQRVTSQSGVRKSSLAMGQDPNKLYMVSDANGISNIYEMDLTTKLIQPKTNSVAAIKHISMASNHQNMVCAVERQGSDDLFIVDDITTLGVTSDLEPTELRKKYVEQINAAAKIAKTISTTTDASAHDKLVGYGVFDLDFSRQRAVIPNTKSSAVANEDVSQTNTSLLPGNVSALQAQPYSPKLSSDLVIANPSFNAFWGLQCSLQSQFSDMLGDHQLSIDANVLFNFRNLDVQATYSYLPDVIDYEATAFYTNRWAGTLEGTLSLRFVGVGAKAILPLTSYKRNEAGVRVVSVGSDNLDFPNLPSYSRLLLVPEIKFTHDDTKYWLGMPIDGVRYTAIVDALPPLSDNAYQFARLRFDGRGYLPIGESIILAGRTAFGVNGGGNPLRFFAGGAENWLNPDFANGVLPFRRPEDLFFNNMVMPLRGWTINQINGTKFFALNGEIRVPAARLFGRSSLPSFVQSVIGTAFVDVGGAWTDSFQATVPNPFGSGMPGNLLTSVGVGLRALLFNIPLKVDVAWANLVAQWAEPRWVISMGLDF